MDTLTAQDSQVGSGAIDPVQCLCPADTSPNDPVHRLCLAGLTVLPVPDVDNIADVLRQAKNRLAQLASNNSTQETLIYRNATTAHLDALAVHIATTRTEANDKYLDATSSGGDHEAAHRDYNNTIKSEATYPGLVTFLGDKSGLLFFKMRSFGESAPTYLRNKIIIWGHRMGQNLASPSSSGTRIPAADPTQRKQPSASVQPACRRGIGGHFPTLVIEQGNSQLSLRDEKDWWFRNSHPDQWQGDVKVVVLVKVDRAARSICIEVWDREKDAPVQTVAVTALPEEESELEVKLPGGIPLEENRWVVGGAPLEIDEASLAAMAAKCWRGEAETV